MLAFIFNTANNVGYRSYFDVQEGDGHHQLSDVDGSRGHTFQTELPNAAAVFKNHFASLSPGVSATRATVSPATVTRGQAFQVGSSISSSTARTRVVKYGIRSASNSALMTSQSYTAQAFTIHRESRRAAVSPSMRETRPLPRTGARRRASIREAGDTPRVPSRR